MVAAQWLVITGDLLARPNGLEGAELNLDGRAQVQQQLARTLARECNLEASPDGSGFRLD